MSVAISVERFSPGIEQSLPSDRVVLSSMDVGGVIKPHYETADFPLSDPWSLMMRSVVRQKHSAGWFDSQWVTEGGAGDSRNLRGLNGSVKGVTAIEIEDWRLFTAWENMRVDGIHERIPVELWRGNVVDFLQNYRQLTGRERVEGRFLMCLPQSPEGVNVADTYKGEDSLNGYQTRWDETGLTLNAAVLDHLREIADPELSVLAIISNRVRPDIVQGLVEETGWRMVENYKTREPIQQDPDTGIGWVEKIDDGQRFYEQTAAGFAPISAVIAEKRRVTSLESGLGRKELNVYHHLTVYELKPRK